MNIPRSPDDESEPLGDYSRDEKRIEDTQREEDLNWGAPHSPGASEARKKPPVKRQGFKSKVPATSSIDTPIAQHKKRAPWKKPEVGLHF